MPSDYNGGTINATFYWKSPSSSTNSVVWQFQSLAINAGDSMDALNRIDYQVIAPNSGSVQWLAGNATGTTYTISSLDFEPKAIRFYWVGLSSASPTNAVSQAVTERRGIGFAVSTTNRRCVGTYNLDNSAAADAGSVAGNTEVVITVNGSGVIDGRLDITSFTTTGFVLTVDDAAPVDITVF